MRRLLVFGPTHPNLIDQVALARHDDFRTEAERARLMAELRPAGAQWLAFGGRMRRWLGRELIRAGEFVARGVPAEGAEPCRVAA
jgi:hypothetical protein